MKRIKADSKMKVRWWEEDDGGKTQIFLQNRNKDTQRQAKDGFK